MQSDVVAILPAALQHAPDVVLLLLAKAPKEQEKGVRQDQLYAQRGRVVPAERANNLYCIESKYRESKSAQIVVERCRRK